MNHAPQLTAYLMAARTAHLAGQEFATTARLRGWLQAAGTPAVTTCTAR